MPIEASIARRPRGRKTGVYVIQAAGRLPSKAGKKKVLAVASGGGHWAQMMLIRPVLDRYQTLFITTIPGLAEESGIKNVRLVPDCNKDRPLAVLSCILALIRQIASLRPDVILSTGAAPGILAISIGRLFGARTIWIDSLANAERLSLSGRLAQRLSHECLTQWEHLAGARVEYHGRLL
jgi:UDP-N-acetylglucosamine:LPS N-acetylglucosamine transferase